LKKVKRKNRKKNGKEKIGLYLYYIVQRRECVLWGGGGVERCGIEWRGSQD
jgi:hypothetical protein